jgi:D-galactonate transporter
MLFGCYVVAYLDRVNVGFAKLQMLHDLKFSDTVYGLGAGVFFLGYFVFEIPSNVILHRTGARRWIARIMVTWGLVSSGMMFVTTPVAFYVMRFLLGLAEAGFFPGIILYLTYWYPLARRGRITAFFMTAIAFSGVVGGPLSGWIMQHLAGVNNWAGWQWLFLLEGIPSILIGVVVWFYLDDSIVAANWLTGDEKKLLAANIAKEVAGIRESTIFQALVDPRVLLLAVIYFLFVMGLYGIGFWLPQLIKNTGVTTPFMVGLLSTIPYAGAAVSMILVSQRSDRSGERRWHTAIPAFLGGCGLVLGTRFEIELIPAVIFLTVATAGILTALPVFWTLPTRLLSGTAAAAGIGLINSFGNLAGFVSPFLVGYVQDMTGKPSWGLVGIAACLGLGAILVVVAVPAADGVGGQTGEKVVR